jgi:hypothetical protein
MCCGDNGEFCCTGGPCADTCGPACICCKHPDNTIFCGLPRGGQCSLPGTNNECCSRQCDDNLRCT